MSCPDWACASAAYLAGSWRCAVVSTRTVAPASLPNTSACRRSSASAAGTKWFQLMNVSSRFWAKAGARPNASQDATPVVAPEVTRRNSRREVARMRRLLGTQRAARKFFGTQGFRPTPLPDRTVARFYHPGETLSIGALCSLLRADEVIG